MALAGVDGAELTRGGAAGTAFFCTGAAGFGLAAEAGLAAVAAGFLAAGSEASDAGAVLRPNIS
jgi:hypothetical protein